MGNSGVKQLALALSGLACCVSAFPTALDKAASACAAFNSSSFVINQFQLYPENAKFDSQRCVVYFG